MKLFRKLSNLIKTSSDFQSFTPPGPGIQQLDLDRSKTHCDKVTRAGSKTATWETTFRHITWPSNITSDIRWCITLSRMSWLLPAPNKDPMNLQMCSQMCAQMCSQMCQGSAANLTKESSDRWEIPRKFSSRTFEKGSLLAHERLKTYPTTCWGCGPPPSPRRS